MWTLISLVSGAVIGRYRLRLEAEAAQCRYGSYPTAII